MIAICTKIGTSIYFVTKGCYKNNKHRKIRLKKDSIGAIVSAGTFTHGHIGPNVFDELLRIIKPVIKKLTTFVQKKLGKKVTKPSRQDIMTDKYREKKGLPPIKR